jgi:hypothetical protein
MSVVVAALAAAAAAADAVARISELAARMTVRRGARTAGVTEASGLGTTGAPEVPQ